MIRFPNAKIHNAYIIETYDYESIKNTINEFAIKNGFDENLVLKNTHPDIHYIEETTKEFDIKRIREELIDDIYYEPTVNDRKFYIIYDGMYLKELVQNAILKSLEEPPAYITIFIVTSNAKKLLPTIISRCIVLKDNREIDYDKLYSLEFVDDLLNILANLNYEGEAEIMDFAKTFDSDETSYKDFITLTRVIIRDAMYYKKTLKRDRLDLKQKTDGIILVANALTFTELNNMIEGLNFLSKLKNLNINKKIAVFNFISGSKNGKVFRNTL